MFIEEIQHIFLNPRTNLDFSSDNPFFYCIPPRNISDIFAIIRRLGKFLKPGLISSTKFDVKLGFPTGNHKRTHKHVMDLLPNDWKHLLRPEASQKFLLKTFYYNNTATRNKKDFQTLSNKKIYFTLQSNSTKYNKLFKFTSWPNYFEGHLRFQGAMVS